MEKELQAVILAAGKGSRITELTSSIPKCLLPIANKPMIYYPLSLLEKAGFKEVLIIVPDAFEVEISKAVKDVAIKTDLFPIPSAKDLGTAESLRLAQHKIKHDFILLSCDTIVDFDLVKMINAYRLHYPTVLALISTVLPIAEGSVPGRKGKQKLDRDLIALEAKGENKLILLSCEADFEEEIQFRISTLRSCPSFEVHTNYLDTHIYIFQHWVLNYLSEKQHILSVKGELIPSLIRRQFRNYRKPNEQTKECQRGVPSIIDSTSDTFGCDKLLTALGSLECKEEEKCGANVTVFSTVKCNSYLLHTNCFRANHLLTYMEANKHLSKTDSPTTPSTPGTPRSRAQVGSDCVIGDNTCLGEKTSIKRCIIGKGCSIGEKVRLANCVIMDNVKIEESCVIQGSVICSNVFIGQSAEIKDSVIAARQKVDAYAKHVNEVIMHYDHLMQL